MTPARMVRSPGHSFCFTAAAILCIGAFSCTSASRDEYSPGPPITVSTERFAAPSTRVSNPIPATSTTFPANVAASPEEAAATERLGVAVDQLLSRSAVSVRYEGRLDNVHVSGDATVRNDVGALRSSETVESGTRGRTIVADEILTSDALYARFLGSNDDPATASWTRLEPGSLRQSILDDVYTAGGASGPSLPRIVALLGALPFDVDSVESRMEDGTPVELLRVTFLTADVAELFRRTGAERVGVMHPRGVTQFTFVISADSGDLMGMRAYGTQFHDGEALDDVDIRLSYTSVEPAPIQAPPPDQVLRSR